MNYRDNGEVFQIKGTTAGLYRPNHVSPTEWRRWSPEFKAALLGLCIRAFDNYFNYCVGSPTAETARQGTQCAGANPARRI